MVYESHLRLRARVQAKASAFNKVYRYEPRTGSIRAVADRFGRLNGIYFSPNEKVVYITDTDRIHRDGATDGMRASTM